MPKQARGAWQLLCVGNCYCAVQQKSAKEALGAMGLGIDDGFDRHDFADC
jgi:hypothetical protein